MDGAYADGIGDGLTITGPNTLIEASPGGVPGHTSYLGGWRGLRDPT